MEKSKIEIRRLCRELNATRADNRQLRAEYRRISEENKRMQRQIEAGMKLLVRFEKEAEGDVIPRCLPRTEVFADKIHEAAGKTVAEIQKAAHEIARAHGWWDGEDRRDMNCVPAALALVHSEVSEALEEFRNPEVDILATRFVGGKPEGFGIELADAVIRIADLCGFLGIDLADVIKRKMAYNAGRPWRHGGKRV